MSTIKKTISIPSELAEEIIAINANFSATVEAALVTYLHQYRVKKALKSYGKWHVRKTASIDIVNDLRQEENHGNHLN